MEASQTNHDDLYDRHISLLSAIARRANEWTVLDDLNDEERKALDIKGLNEIISFDFPEVIRKLKLESYAKFLVTLEEEIKFPLMFRPTPAMIFNLNEISFLGTKPMKEHAERVKSNLIQVVTKEINRKYCADTPLIHLSDGEFNVLLTLRPLLDGVKYPDTVLALHWKVIESKLDTHLDKLATDHDLEIENIRWIIRLQTDVNSPEFIRNKALKLRKLNEKYVIERLSKKYDMQSDVHDLTETEKIVLDRLDVIRNNYPPVVESLHWKVTHIFLCKEFDDFKARKLSGHSLELMPKKLKFLMTNERLPDKTKDKAREFNKILM
ncbi:uncharacterized protein LOC132759727 [Ruditapes philippinarum]|uniref:uncharacterized protein LOC132759727 n=1 Tax=Ruditapes philippinarum TaxID=129788 RepID=UPI00295B7D5F|nr:uncharacterized protein LOC132759727 [Ruditapes philippinarum]XP_060607530.1 uncharacterized protein LOC132759727 [Ruditapes philippinarum]